MKTISTNWLKKHHACKDQIELFIKTFGNKSVPITRENLKKAATAKLFLDWLVCDCPSQILSETQADLYEKKTRYAYLHKDLSIKHDYQYYHRCADVLADLLGL